jgi:hypothetical protein
VAFPPSKSVAVIVALIVLAFAVAAGASEARAATRAQWVAAANAACTKGFAPGHAVQAAWSKNPPTTVTAWNAGFTRIINAETRMRHGLAVIPRAQPDRAAIKTMLTWLDRSVSEMRLARSAEIGLNVPLYRKHIAAAQSYGKRFGFVADELGAHVCAHG